MEYKRRSSLVWPLILIGLGVIFLLNNLGVLDWDVWLLIGQLWPLLLIAVGVDVLLGRRSGWGAVLSLLIIVALFAGGVWFVYTLSPRLGGDFTTQTLSQPLEGASQAEVTIDFGVGTLEVSAIEDAELLASGTFELAPQETLDVDFHQAGELATLRLSSENERFFPSWLLWLGGDNTRNWELGLNGSVPIDLTIASGVGNAQLDLRDLMLSGLEIDSGVGKTVMYLPATSSFIARVEGGVGTAMVYFPEEVGLRIRLNGGLGNTSIQGDFTREGETWTSDNYYEAEYQIDLYLDGGVGSLHVRPY